MRAPIPTVAIGHCSFLIIINDTSPPNLNVGISMSNYSYKEDDEAFNKRNFVSSDQGHPHIRTPYTEFSGRRCRMN